VDLLPHIIEQKRYRDERGWFSETFHQQRLLALGISARFVQDNQSFSRRTGTVRGLHCQAPPAAQAKLISVLRGRILDLAVDVRRGSPTYGQYVAIELSSDTGRQLYLPVGFLHGFVSLEDNVEVMYKVSDFYSPEHERGVRWNDPDIALPWPFGDSEMVISEKDRHLPLLRDFSSPFDYDGQPLRPLQTSSP
jgi:dTDP-4-dehydrorhamnose 3,5-epimerase